MRPIFFGFSVPHCSGVSSNAHGSSTIRTKRTGTRVGPRDLPAYRHPEHMDHSACHDSACLCSHFFVRCHQLSFCAFPKEGFSTLLLDSWFASTERNDVQLLNSMSGFTTTSMHWTWTVRVGRANFLMTMTS